MSINDPRKRPQPQCRQSPSPSPTRVSLNTRAGADTYGVIVSVLATGAKRGVDGLDYLAAGARSPDPGLAILLG